MRPRRCRPCWRGDLTKPAMCPRRAGDGVPHARRIVGWQVSRSMPADFVLDALENCLVRVKRGGSDTSIAGL